MMADIRASLVEENQSSWKPLLCPSPPIRRALVAAVGVAFFQQAVGVGVLCAAGRGSQTRPGACNPWEPLV
jgi:hypothetical protein